MIKFTKGIDQNTGIRYVSFGQGSKTMVIVPGLTVGYVTDTAQGVADAFAAFAEEYTVYLFDIREDVPEDYTIRRMGDDLVSTIKSLGLSKVCLYGCSMGGMQSMYIAGRYPELVEKLVVVSSACKENAIVQEAVADWLLLASEGKCRELMLGMGQRIYSKAVFEASRSIFEALADGLTEEVLARFLRTAGAIRNLDITEDVKAIRCPVLVIGSRGDQVLGGEASSQIAELTGGEVYLYGEETSHAIYDEIPEVKMRAKDFFDK